MANTELKQIDESLWVAQDDLFYAGKSAHFPLRMTVVRLAGGGLLLVSPIKLSECLVTELVRLGPVEHILAPNSFHYLYAGDAKKRYPDAKLWLSPSLPDKRPELVELGQVLQDTPAEWADDLSVVLIKGMPKLQELTLLHGPSRTLIVTDLVFHIQQTKGWLMPAVLRMAGAYKRLGQSRLLRSQVKDRAATRESFAQLLSLDFTRLIMAHGDIVQTDARTQLASALSWIDEGLTRLSPATGTQASSRA